MSDQQDFEQLKLWGEYEPKENSCEHNVLVKIFPPPSPLYVKDERCGFAETLIVKGCLDCGKIWIEDYSSEVKNVS